MDTARHQNSSRIARDKSSDLTLTERPGGLKREGGGISLLIIPVSGIIPLPAYGGETEHTHLGIIKYVACPIEAIHHDCQIETLGRGLNSWEASEQGRKSCISASREALHISWFDFNFVSLLREEAAMTVSCDVICVLNTDLGRSLIITVT